MYTLEQLDQNRTVSFELNFGNLKETMRQADAKEGTLWKLPPSELRVIDGFNVRLNNEKWAKRVRDIANSLKTIGFMMHKPLAGFTGVDENGKQVIYITEGHTRLAAIELANSELPKDKQITRVAVVTHDSKTTTKKDLIAQLILGNRESELAPYEAAIVCDRLRQEGDDVAAIAKALSYSTEWVNGLLMIIDSPAELRQMVAEDVVTATFAIEVIKKHGDKALDVLREALADKAGQDGGDKKVRLTRKDMVPPAVRKFNNAVKNEAPAMYSVLTQLKGSKAFAKIEPELRESLLEVLDKLSKHEVTDEPAVDPNQQHLFGDEQNGAPAAGAGA